MDYFIVGEDAATGEVIWMEDCGSLEECSMRLDEYAKGDNGWRCEDKDACILCRRRTPKGLIDLQKIYITAF